MSFFRGRLKVADVGRGALHSYILRTRENALQRPISYVFLPGNLLLKGDQGQCVSEHLYLVLVFLFLRLITQAKRGGPIHYSNSPPSTKAAVMNTEYSPAQGLSITASCLVYNK